MGKKILTFKLFESTGNYYPGYSDDGTADMVRDVLDLHAKEMNEYIRSNKDKILNDYNKNDDSLQDLLQKWMYANVILTIGQQGILIDNDLFNDAITQLQEILADPRMVNPSSDYRQFKEEISVVLKVLLKNYSRYMTSKRKVYLIGFMQKCQVDKER